MRVLLSTGSCGTGCGVVALSDGAHEWVRWGRFPGSMEDEGVPWS
jgi:hypothetical protein